MNTEENDKENWYKYTKKIVEAIEVLEQRRATLKRNEEEAMDKVTNIRSDFKATGIAINVLYKMINEYESIK